MVFNVPRLFPFCSRGQTAALVKSQDIVVTNAATLVEATPEDDIEILRMDGQSDKTSRTGLHIIAVGVVLAACLFGNDGAASIPFMRRILGEATAVFHDRETQRILVSGVFFYFLVFVFVQRRQAFCGIWRLGALDLWLVGLGAVALVSHFSEGSTSSRSTQALVLLFGLALGKGTRVWMSWQAKSWHPHYGVRAVVALLVALPTVGCLYESPVTTHYYNERRWSGVWGNPNIYGLIMGLGITLAVGAMALGNAAAQSSDDGAGQGTEIRSRKAHIWPPLTMGLCGMAAGIMGLGLLKSYSRGAWVATMCGTGYLCWRFGCVQFPIFTRRVRGHLVSLVVVAFSISVVFFFHFRHTEWHPARRALSLANASDFSWRNRVASYVASLQILGDHPWFGVGWNHPEPTYEYYYRPGEVVEAGAIGSNDYLMVGSTLGLPALAAFFVYVWLSLRWDVGGATRSRSSVAHCAPAGLAPPALDYGLRPPTCPRVVCRAGAVVLLVGFWFDGGLFKLATAAPFWILLELGREDEPRMALNAKS